MKGLEMIVELLSTETQFERKLGKITAEAGVSLPYEYYAAAYGIAYAIQTARVSGAVASRIERMSDEILGATLEQIAGEELNIGDVPRWLNTKFGGGA